MTLKQAWSQAVDAGDYERHMAAVGQAEANAHIVRELVRAAGLEPGAAVLMAGAGPGQMFDFVSPALFEPYRLVCSDINASFLEQLKGRLRCETVVDDVEATQLEAGFAAVILVLVLEHVDWRKALRSLAGLGARCWMIVIQQNTPEFASAVTPGRVLAGTMRIFADDVHPRLIERDELVAEMASLGYLPRREEVRGVADGKRMRGLLFAAAEQR